MFYVYQSSNISYLDTL